jgi:hypothetical protein
MRAFWPNEFTPPTRRVSLTRGEHGAMGGRLVLTQRAGRRDGKSRSHDAHDRLGDHDRPDSAAPASAWAMRCRGTVVRGTRVANQLRTSCSMPMPCM